MNRANIISANYHLRMLEAVLNYIRNNLEEFKNTPAITIYYRILMTLTVSEDITHYRQLIKLLDKNFHLFCHEEARQMYDFAQNYCIKKINWGTISFGKELFTLYKKLLENKIIFKGKYLSQWDFKNIATIALREEEFDWMKNFVQKYKEHVAPEFRKNAFAYNMAAYYFGIEKYREALKLM